MPIVTERFRQNPRLANQAGIADAAAILDEVIEQLRLETASRAQQAAQQFEQKLLPEQANRPDPGAAIVSVTSTTVVEINTEAELKALVGGRGFTFTPVYRSTAYPAAVRYIGAQTQVFHLEGEGLSKKIALTKSLPQGLCVLGLELTGSCDSLEGMQLFFPGLDPEMRQQLSWARLHVEGRVYRLIKANYPEVEKDLAHTTCDREFLLLDRKRREIAEATAKLGVFRLEEVQENYRLRPFETESFGLDLPEQKQQLVKWGQLVLPEGVDPKVLSECRITANALPVFNAFSSLKDVGLEQNSQSHNPIVPIEVGTDEVFLSLGRIWTRTEHPYSPRALFPDRTATYELGVRDPDFLGLLDIPGLIQTLRSAIDSANPVALKSLSTNNRDVLQQYRSSIQTIAQEWQKISQGLQQIAHDTYYLTLYPPVNAQTVYIEVWRINAALSGTLLPEKLELAHTISGCDSINMLVTPDKIKYAREDLSFDPPALLRDIFPNLSTT